MFGISAYAQAPYASLGENTVVVALTGLSASGNVGALTPSSTVALTGLAASGFVGTLTATGSQAESGDQANGFVGTVTPSLTVALTRAFCVWFCRNTYSRCNPNCSYR